MASAMALGLSSQPACGELGQAMRFSYAATAGLPWLITHAENHWAVRPLSPNRSLVEARAEVALRPFPGLLVGPLLQLRRAAERCSKS